MLVLSTACVFYYYCDKKMWWYSVQPNFSHYHIFLPHLESNKQAENKPNMVCSFGVSEVLFLLGTISDANLKTSPKIGLYGFRATSLFRPAWKADTYHFTTCTIRSWGVGMSAILQLQYGTVNETASRWGRVFPEQASITLVREYHGIVLTFELIPETHKYIKLVAGFSLTYEIIIFA